MESKSKQREYLGRAMRFDANRFQEPIPATHQKNRLDLRHPNIRLSLSKSSKNAISEKCFERKTANSFCVFMVLVL
jgi:hypothetical protein